METGTFKSGNSIEGIDFSKLRTIIRNNRLWILAIFVTINLLTYLLFIRYSPDVYESHSEIKLDIRNEATELGINTLVEDQNLNVMSGEIEIIQSKLFLARVLDSLKIDVSYFNKGEILNYEFFGNQPFNVDYTITRDAFYDVPIFIDIDNPETVRLRVNQDGPYVSGKYGQPIDLKGLTVTVRRSSSYTGEGGLNCFFVINSPEVLMNYLMRNLSVEPINFNANTIRISFKDHNPQKAQAVVNKIDSLYLIFSNEQKTQANRQKIMWLTNELGQIEEKMSQYETYFEDFILANKTNNLDEELTNTIRVIHEIDSQRYQLNTRIAGINELLDGLSTGDFSVNPMQRLYFPQAINDNLDKLSQLQMAFDRLKLSYSEVTFAFREREQEIRRLQEEVTRQLTELRDAWMRRLRRLNEQKQEAEREFAQMPDRNTQFNKNQRFYKLYEEFYLMLMQSKSEFEIAQAGSIPDFKILSSASLSNRPIAPNKPMIMGIGFVFSLVFNLFFIGILYLANNKITSVHELEQLHQVPLLGIIPASHHSNGGSLHVVAHPKSMATEAFRTLRTNLDFFNPSATTKTIAISSTVSGEGKSFVAMNLGGVTALSGKRVVLLDLDMRKPKHNLPTSLNNGHMGMSTILIAKNTWQECLVRTDVQNLDYIPAGPHPPNPSELLLNKEFDKLLVGLKEHYDVIILDTPPVGLVTDGIMAMKKADLSIYLFRANYSKKEFLHNLKRIVSINKLTNMATLLNAMSVSDKKGYGYGYYEEDTSSKLKSIFKI
ncbi:MAG TPA: polysaccharide biosynthesis tyrosine autokinase [Cyclobacteriaceae bacterium]